MNHSKHQSVWAHWGPAVSLWTQLTNQAGTNRPSEACYAYVSADQSLDKCNRCRKAMQKSKSSELHIRWQSGSYVLRRHFKIVSFCAARVKSMQVNHCCFWSSIVSFLLLAGFGSYANVEGLVCILLKGIYPFSVCRNMASDVIVLAQCALWAAALGGSRYDCWKVETFLFFFSVPITV